MYDRFFFLLQDIKFGTNIDMTRDMAEFMQEFRVCCHFKDTVQTTRSFITILLILILGVGQTAGILSNERII